MAVLGTGSGFCATPGAAQVRTIDPNQAVDSDLSSPPPSYAAPQQQRSDYPPDDPVPAGPQDDGQLPSDQRPDYDPQQPVDRQSQDQRGGDQRGGDQRGGDQARQVTSRSATYQRRDVFSAGERVFGKGAQGLAEILEKILKDQGEPNAYIAGREASGAAIIGLRYGSGILSHRVEGDLPVYWTGPSVGFDIGGNASKVFVLVYNLYDTQDIYHRYPEGEGHLYFVGGFSATYLRRGNTVLIPIRLGVGLRAGVNVGYMKIRKKQHWLPF